MHRMIKYTQQLLLDTHMYLHIYSYYPPPHTHTHTHTHAQRMAMNSRKKLRKKKVFRSVLNVERAVVQTRAENSHWMVLWMRKLAGQQLLVWCGGF